MKKANTLVGIFLCILFLFSLPVVSYADGSYESGLSDGRKAVLEELLNEIPYDKDNIKEAFYNGAISEEDVLILYYKLISTIEDKYNEGDLLNIHSLGDYSDSNPSVRSLANIQEDSSSVPTGTTYILNTNTKKFHKPSCSSVNDMKDSNKAEFVGNRSDVIERGYDPCGRCKP